MSILKDVKVPQMPLALGLVLSSCIAVAVQGMALPAMAQDADDAPEVGTQMGGIEAFGGDSDAEDIPPQFAMLPDRAGFSGGGAFHMGPGEHGGPGGPGGHGHHGFMSEANKLTDDQWEKLYAIKEDLMDSMGTKMLQCRTLGRKLKDTLTASNIDTKAAQDLSSKISALKAELSSIRMDAMIKMAQVLTPEQRKEIRLKMIKHCLGGRHKRFGHHWGFGASRGHHAMMGK